MFGVVGSKVAVKKRRSKALRTLKDCWIWIRSYYLMSQNQKVKEDGREFSCTSFDMFITIGFTCLVCIITALLSVFEYKDFPLLFAVLPPKLISEYEF